MAFKDIVKSLPLDSISEALAGVVLWWTRLVKDVPEDKLPVYTYVGASVIVLLLLFLVLRIVPKAARGIIWLISAAILLTPGTAAGDSGEIAPAIIGVLHGFLMGDSAQAMKGILSILAVIVVGLIVGAVWQLIRAAIESRLKSAQDEKDARAAEEAAELAKQADADARTRVRIQATAHAHEAAQQAQTADLNALAQADDGVVLPAQSIGNHHSQDSLQSDTKPVPVDSPSMHSEPVASVNTKD